MDDDSNIVQFPNREYITTGNIDPKGVLEGVTDNELDTVIVLGWTKDDKEYFASSTANGMEILWLLERLKIRIMMDE